MFMIWNEIDFIRVKYSPNLIWSNIWYFADDNVYFFQIIKLHCSQPPSLNPGGVTSPTTTRNSHQRNNHGDIPVITHTSSPLTNKFISTHQSQIPRPLFPIKNTIPIVSEPWVLSSPANIWVKKMNSLVAKGKEERVLEVFRNL